MPAAARGRAAVVTFGSRIAHDQVVGCQGALISGSLRWGDMATRARDYDLVLFGASGFVGALTARHLAGRAPVGARIALAGRSRERLEAVRRQLPGDGPTWPIEVADAHDDVALRALAARTSVVVTTVGPYAAYGLPLARACAGAGTHYADLTGEVLFVREVIDACEPAARETGARLVPSCGFDAVPSDLGVLVLAEQVAADGAGTLGETTLRVRSLKGGLSGGTIASMRGQTVAARASAEARRVLADPYGLSPDRAAEPPAHARRSPRGGLTGVLDQVSALTQVRAAGGGRWDAPFVMASYNTRVVRRSNAVAGYRYGRDFRYAEVTDCGPGVAGLAKAAALTGALGGLVAGLSFAPTRAVLDRVLPAPGEGPSEQAQAAGRFVLDIATTTTTGAQYVARVAADRDPGYSGTAVMLGESGLALAYDELPEAPGAPGGGGVLTPATALGDALVARLRQQGFTLDVRRVSTEESPANGRRRSRTAPDSAVGRRYPGRP